MNIIIFTIYVFKIVFTTNIQIILEYFTASGSHCKYGIYYLRSGRTTFLMYHLKRISYKHYKMFKLIFGKGIYFELLRNQIFFINNSPAVLNTIKIAGYKQYNEVGKGTDASLKFPLPWRRHPRLVPVPFSAPLTPLKPFSLVVYKTKSPTIKIIVNV